MLSRRKGRSRLVNLSLMTLLLVAPAGAQIIDRVLAVVSGGLILQSDAVAARRLHLVEVRETPDPVQSALDQLIERRLILIDVDRYGPAEPSQAEIDAGVTAIMARTGSGDSVDAIFRETGYSTEQLRLFVRDDLRIRAYLQQRFGAALTPTDDEITEYYRTHDSAFTVGGVVRPFQEVREAARAALVAERRSTMLREWLAGLRRRADVNVLYIPIR
ncbi:hypothetical protein BH18ACI5_BH18ACI5_16730 [soil metagenome]